MSEPRSAITCPRCGHRHAETMPIDACQFFYDCRGCGALLLPEPDDCCVFCSYGSVPCPPVQAGEKKETAMGGSAGPIVIEKCFAMIETKPFAGASRAPEKASKFKARGQGDAARLVTISGRVAGPPLPSPSPSPGAWRRHARRPSSPEAGHEETAVIDESLDPLMSYATLWDWRRQVAELYAELRGMADAETAWRL
jgi:hypothetical protein